MYNILIESLTEWNNTVDGRKKLQHAYLMVAIVLLLTAGVIGLINYGLGQKILFIAILSIVTFLVNAVAWALLQSFVLLKLNTNNLAKKSSKIKSKKR